ncbi:purine nucleoside transporter PunC [Vibrio maerlii]|uniref:purine nucleoside transporter PunC n=1 Tax=Vibrio maerlii TaxID=2231648 RepID=UPI000E3D843E|nr:purine nucleoside transporter PunC [Vibrio maerlii]
MKISNYQLFYLAVLSMLGFIATDMYLPAFKVIEASLNTGPEKVALSLTVFLVGMGLGQISWGIISDRIGHRASLLIGLSIFAISSAGLAIADQVWQLLSLRFVQAIGVCAPAVIWQAIVIQRYSSNSQQIFATLMPLVALSPALAPQFGVLLVNSFGWQSIFWSLGVIGVLLVIATIKQSESQNVSSNRNTVADIKGLFGSKLYVGNVVIFASASAAFFAYLTGMPELMTQLGYDTEAIGLSFVPQTIAFMLGGYLGKRSVKRFGDEKVLRNLIAMLTIAGLLLFMTSQWTLTSIWPILAPFCLLALANGALYPIVVNRALSSASHSPATAAGLQNSIQICISSVASGAVALYASQVQTATGIAIILCIAGIWLGYIISNQSLSSQFTTPDNSRVARDEEF